MINHDQIDRKFLILYGLSLFALIFISVMPGDSLPKMGSGLDKVEHLLAYFVVAALAFKAFKESKTRNAICVFMIGVGVLLEVGHKYVPGRFFEYADMGANVAGVVIAYWFVRRFTSPRE